MSPAALTSASVFLSLPKYEELLYKKINASNDLVYPLLLLADRYLSSGSKARIWRVAERTRGSHFQRGAYYRDGLDLLSLYDCTAVFARPGQWMYLYDRHPLEITRSFLCLRAFCEKLNKALGILGEEQFR